MRVPFLAISASWSKGGAYVNLKVFDHTSVIQFIEKRFGVHEINISPWRRAVAGDLTSAFNFVNPNEGRTSFAPATSGFLLPPQNESSQGPAWRRLSSSTLDGLILGGAQTGAEVRPARAFALRSRCSW